jgi:transcriptional regulator GlxA family with amidase domain
MRAKSCLLALALLVARVGLADNYDATVPADHLAVLADRFDAWAYFHRVYLG